MAARVASEGPVTTRKHICEHCGYELEFNNVDLVPHRSDGEGDPLEIRGMYLICPRIACAHRNLIDRAKGW